MAAVYVETRPKVRQEGSAITDYVVEDHADHVLHNSQTQHAAIDLAERGARGSIICQRLHSSENATPRSQAHLSDERIAFAPVQQAPSPYPSSYLRTR